MTVFYRRIGRGCWKKSKAAWINGNGYYKICPIRGRTLVASLLWYRLACVDPHPHFSSEVQAALVHFWGDKLHLVPQGILYLPKEEGGQGLIHQQSRIAAFHLRFLQRFLDGSTDCSWRAVSCMIMRTLGGFGLDKMLFVMDPTNLDLSELPVFYRNLFKVWSLFHVQKTKNSFSLHWLLQEPLIFGACYFTL